MNCVLGDIRRAAQLTQLELADRARIKLPRLQAIERQIPTDWLQLERLCRELHASADQILGLAPPPPPPVDALVREDRQLLTAMEQAAIDLLGPKLLAQVGGWRRIALSRW